MQVTSPAEVGYPQARPASVAIMATRMRAYVISDSQLLLVWRPASDRDQLLGRGWAYLFSISAKHMHIHTLYCEGASMRLSKGKSEISVREWLAGLAPGWKIVRLISEHEAGLGRKDMDGRGMNGQRSSTFFLLHCLYLVSFCIAFDCI